MSETIIVPAEFEEEENNRKRYFGKKRMGEDGRYIVPISFDGVEVEFCPSVFEDFRFMMALSQLNEIDEEDTSPENAMELFSIQRELFTLMFGKKQYKKIMNKLAAANGGFLDAETFMAFHNLVQKAAVEAEVDVKN